MLARGVLAAAALLLAAQCTLAEEHTIQAIAQRGYESMLFEPDYLVVQPGDRITFEVDDADHQPQSAFVPAGASGWQAEKGEPISVQLSVPGVYVFDCAYHNVMGMAGVIVVSSPVNLPEARAFFARYVDRTVFIDKDRLQHIWDPESGLLARWP